MTSWLGARKDSITSVTRERSGLSKGLFRSLPRDWWLGWSGRSCHCSGCRPGLARWSHQTLGYPLNNPHQKGRWQRWWQLCAPHTSPLVSSGDVPASPALRAAPYPALLLLWAAVLRTLSLICLDNCWESRIPYFMSWILFICRVRWILANWQLRCFWTSPPIKTHSYSLEHTLTICEWKIIGPLCETWFCESLKFGLWALVSWENIFNNISST